MRGDLRTERYWHEHSQMGHKPVRPETLRAHLDAVREIRHPNPPLGDMFAKHLIITGQWLGDNMKHAAEIFEQAAGEGYLISSHGDRYARI